MAAARARHRSDTAFRTSQPSSRAAGRLRRLHAQGHLGPDRSRGVVHGRAGRVLHRPDQRREPHAAARAGSRRPTRAASSRCWTTRRATSARSTWRSSSADGQLDEKAFGEAVRLGVRLLDDVVEVNDYVTPEIDRLCRSNRKIGLGVMGFADALFELGIAYDSEPGAGVWPAGRGDPRRRGRRRQRGPGRRAGRVCQLRGQRLGPAGPARPQRRADHRRPDGHAEHHGGHDGRHRAGVRAGVLPAHPRRRGAHRGGRPVPPLRRAAGVLDGATRPSGSRPGGALGELADVAEPWRRVFVTAREIAPRWHVRMQAAFQEYVDGAISKTINLPKEAAPEDVDEIYRLAYEAGLQGRDGLPRGLSVRRADDPRAGRDVLPAVPQARRHRGRLQPMPELRRDAVWVRAFRICPQGGELLS